MKDKPKIPNVLQDALLILLAALMTVVIFCYAWACCDRLSWVRFVLILPIPPALKAILWGWW